MGGLGKLFNLTPKEELNGIADLEREMLEAAHDLEFERAATLRDELKLLKSQL